MEDQLKEEFDYVLLGTNIENSILAAALSRVGKRVLHVDKNKYYGDNHATVTFKELNSLFHPDNEINNSIPSENSSELDAILTVLNSPIPVSETIWNQEDIEIINKEPIIPKEISKTDLNIIPILCKNSMYKDIQEYCLTEDIEEKEDDILVIHKKSIMNDLIKKNYKYNLDMNGTLVYSRGNLVDTLLEAGINEYTEFVPIESTFLYDDNETLNHLIHMPTCKQDIFSNKDINMKEKRLLTKFIQYSFDLYIKNQQENPEYINEINLQQGRSLSRPQNKQLIDVSIDEFLNKNILMETFLKDQFQFNNRCLDIVLYSLCFAETRQTYMNDSGVLCPLYVEDALKRLFLYISGQRVYSNTSFIYPLYGMNSIIESFCRTSAIYGGIYMLNTKPKAILQEKSNQSVRGILMEDGSVYRCKRILLDESYSLENEIENTQQSPCLRGLALFSCNTKATSNTMDQSSNTHEVTRDILVFPPSTYHNSYTIYGLFLDSNVHCCPKDEYCVYLYTYHDDKTSIQDIYSSFSEILIYLQKEYNCTLMYSAYYNESYYKNTMDSKVVTVIPSHISSLPLSMYGHLERVKTIFHQLEPDLPFLPKTHSALKEEKMKEKDDNSQMISTIDSLLNECENEVSTINKNKQDQSLTENEISTISKDKQDHSLTENEVSTINKDKQNQSLTENKISYEEKDKQDSSSCENEILCEKEQIDK